MVTKIVWECELDQAPKHRYTFAAFPGVGNVGKLLVDGLVDGLESRKYIDHIREIIRMII